jgi:hypothetical protein
MFPAAAVGFAIWLVSDQIVEVIDEKEDWRHSWWHESFWHALFFAILFAIVVIFRPTNNNMRCVRVRVRVRLGES